MRISDWSSDVCSSDLQPILWVVPGDRGHPSRVGRGQFQQIDALIRGHYQIGFKTRTYGLNLQVGPQAFTAAAGGIPNDPAHGEIGRASCRERVCQYV